jgi:hypothetical protein
MVTTSFISALIIPESMRWRSIDTYKEYFAHLASTGIPLYIYLNKGLETYGEQLEKEYSNVKVLEYITIDKSFLPDTVILPAYRNEQKDTSDYMCIQLMKLKLLSRASADIRILTDYIAWVDFGIWHFIKSADATTEKLKRISEYNWPCKSIYMPGCWDDRDYNIIHHICWRYCGSFVIGHRELFNEIFSEQQRLVAQYLPHLRWEINYWSKIKGITWYCGSHDDTIFNVPML